MPLYRTGAAGWSATPPPPRVRRALLPQINNVQLNPSPPREFMTIKHSYDIVDLLIAIMRYARRLRPVRKRKEGQEVKEVRREVESDDETKVPNIIPARPRVAHVWVRSKYGGFVAKAVPLQREWPDNWASTDSMPTLEGRAIPGQRSLTGRSTPNGRTL